MQLDNPHFLTSVVTSRDYPLDQKKEVVLLGRSNVGKSTFINCFCQRKKLAYTSSRPGKTQILNFFEINNFFRLVDVPGYGYARVSQRQRQKFGEMIEEYLVARKNLSFAVLLIDFKVGPTSDDLLMYDFLQHYQVDVVIIATKVDKVKQSHRIRQKKVIHQKMTLDDQQIYYYSANVKEDMERIYRLFDEKLKAK